LIRPTENADFQTILTIVNEAAAIYKGAIPADCWHEPYMPPAELAAEIAAGVDFSGFEDADALRGVMGLQTVADVVLIRHAYVRPADQGRGIGSALLRELQDRADRPLLIGTWAAATWARRFYEKHGFREVDRETKDRLLRTYWSIPARQTETSVVLGDHRWWAAHGG
jgi:GNAT superfamily N-acetyltransferase